MGGGYCGGADQVGKVRVVGEVGVVVAAVKKTHGFRTQAMASATQTEHMGCIDRNRGMGVGHGTGAGRSRGVGRVGGDLGDAPRVVVQGAMGGTC